MEIKEPTTQKELVAKIDFMMKSEFLQPEQIKSIDEEMDKWIKFLDDEFGDNDGEQLGEEGINFIISLFKYRLMDNYCVLQE